MKICSKCKQKKELCEFCSYKRSKDGKTYYCRTCRNERHKQWRSKNAPKIIAWTTGWYNKNKDKMRSYHANRRKEERKDPLKRAIFNLRRRLNKVLKGHTKSESLKTILGVSVEGFKQHIEARFQPGMTWDNYGLWHLDHVIPISFGNTVKEIENLCYFTNLQPLWAIDNKKKGNRVQAVNLNRSINSLEAKV